MSKANLETKPKELAAIYLPKVRAALAESIVPFWQRAIDAERGGVFSCWNNAGTELESRDKFVWSQGRFVWLWSRLAELARHGSVPGDAAAYLAHAAKTVAFLRQHALLPDGRCAFLLGEDGEVKEAVAGDGPAPSIYSDCFVAMGLAEYARVAGDREVFEIAWQLATNIEQLIAAGGVPTYPAPIPDGYEPHAVAMIWLNVTLVIHDACAALNDDRLPLAREHTVAAAGIIFGRFLLPNGRIAELRSVRGGEDHTLLSRHLNPGHSLECLWMLLTVAKREKRDEWIGRACKAVTLALERGWDEQHGGLLHFTDIGFPQPVGARGASAYEENVRATWDTKLWWVHSEALYTSAFVAQISGDAAMRAWFEKIWDYTLRTFPQPDRAVGEWIQIRDRNGAPFERIVALPVKDPYHIARNLIQLLELFAPKAAAPRA